MWFWGSLAVFTAWAVWRRNWWALGTGVVLGGLFLLNDAMDWLQPMHFGAAAAGIALIVFAPRPAWITLTIAACAAMAVHTAMLLVPYPPETPAFLGEVKAYVTVTECVTPCGGTMPGWYLAQTPSEPPPPLLSLPFLPAWLVVAGLLVWAIRRRSWRTALAAIAFGALVLLQPHQAPLALFAAAAAALGPRRDPFFLAGIGVLALALADEYDAWNLLVQIITIATALGLGIWALARKNGVNVALALVTLAVAPLTPFLSAGVLLVSPLLRRAARSAGTPGLQPAE